jgi:hypothetical protein
MADAVIEKDLKEIKKIRENPEIMPNFEKS